MSSLVSTEARTLIKPYVVAVVIAVVELSVIAVVAVIELPVIAVVAVIAKLPVIAAIAVVAKLPVIAVIAVVPGIEIEKQPTVTVIAEVPVVAAAVKQIAKIKTQAKTEIAGIVVPAESVVGSLAAPPEDTAWRKRAVVVVPTVVSTSAFQTNRVVVLPLRLGIGNPYVVGTSRLRQELSVVWSSRDTPLTAIASKITLRHAEHRCSTAVIRTVITSVQVDSHPLGNVACETVDVLLRLIAVSAIKSYLAKTAASREERGTVTSEALASATNAKVVATKAVTSKAATGTKLSALSAEAVAIAKGTK